MAAAAAIPRTLNSVSVYTGACFGGNAIDNRQNKVT